MVAFASIWVKLDGLENAKICWVWNNFHITTIVFLYIYICAKNVYV